MTFDEYWRNNWHENTMPPIFNEAMREIAKKAWDMATLVEKDRRVEVCQEIQPSNYEFHNE